MVRTKDNIAKLTLKFTAITDQVDIPGDRPFFILIHEHIIHGYKIILDSSMNFLSGREFAIKVTWSA